MQIKNIVMARERYTRSLHYQLITVKATRVEDQEKAKREGMKEGILIQKTQQKRSRKSEKIKRNKTPLVIMR